MSDSPRPWSCSRDGTRLLWQRTALVCPSCGPIHGLPPWPTPTTEDEQQ